jgi:hypothetical protein
MRRKRGEDVLRLVCAVLAPLFVFVEVLLCVVDGVEGLVAGWLED